MKKFFLPIFAIAVLAAILGFASLKNSSDEAISPSNDSFSSERITPLSSFQSLLTNNFFTRIIRRIKGNGGTSEDQTVIDLPDVGLSEQSSRFELTPCEGNLQGFTECAGGAVKQVTGCVLNVNYENGLEELNECSEDYGANILRCARKFCPNWVGTAPGAPVKK